MPNSPIRPFHLAVPVRNIAESRGFYGQLLGLSEGRSSEEWIDFFNWDEAYINDVAKQMNCNVDEISWDHPEGTELRNGNRLYSEWTKSQTFNTVK